MSATRKRTAAVRRLAEIRRALNRAELSAALGEADQVIAAVAEIEDLAAAMVPDLATWHGSNLLDKTRPAPVPLLSVLPDDGEILRFFRDPADPTVILYGTADQYITMDAVQVNPQGELCADFAAEIAAVIEAPLKALEISNLEARRRYLAGKAGAI